MMLLTGDWIDAQEAYRIGLVQKVVPRDQLLDEALKIAEKISENAPNAVKTAKEAAYRGLDVHMKEAMAQCRLFDTVNRQMSAEDIQEGARAFAEKRKPVYRGH
jgi:enoyl-CoA hydratase/carnithine racemase